MPNEEPVNGSCEVDCASKKRGLSRPFAAVILIALPAVLADLLTGLSSPAEFFHPVAVFSLTALYGGGALLVRELSILWGCGWPGRIWLACAYAVVFEGFMVKTFFGFGDIRHSPSLYIDGALGVYWFWAAGIVIFHAGYSILAPIAIAEALVSAENRNVRWFGDAALGAAFIIFALVVCMGFLVFQDERLAANWRVKTLLALAAAALLAFAARKLKFVKPAPARKPAHAIFYFAEFLFLSAAFIAVSKVLPWMIVETGFASKGLATAAVILAGAVAALRARYRFGASNFRAAHLSSAIIGVYLPWILLTALAETGAAQPGIALSGATVIGLVVLILLFVWARAATIIERQNSPSAIPKPRDNP